MMSIGANDIFFVHYCATLVTQYKVSIGNVSRNVALVVFTLEM